MDKVILQYAMKSIQNIQLNGAKPFIDDKSIYIEFPDGRILKIADDEVKYQATQYLESEIDYIKHS